ncbi:MAG: hypothetical protein Q9O62_09705 [Ardenticatenia bacterium]|nr:hypothetical protein [Ardenticatenia bacterium]
MALYRVTEVLNYGGFFAGDTVSLIAVPFGHTEPKLDLVIDEYVFDNLKDRHRIVAGMVLDLTVEQGQKVTAARVMAATTREALRAAVGCDAPVHNGYRICAYRCPHCHLWVRGEPERVSDTECRCRVCGEMFTA